MVTFAKSVGHNVAGRPKVTYSEETVDKLPMDDGKVPERKLAARYLRRRANHGESGEVGQRRSTRNSTRTYIDFAWRLPIDFGSVPVRALSYRSLYNSATERATTGMSKLGGTMLSAVVIG